MIFSRRVCYFVNFWLAHGGTYLGRNACSFVIGVVVVVAKRLL